jgi:hypothetical protein
MVLPERLSTRHWEFLTTLGTVIRLFRCGCRVCASGHLLSPEARISRQGTAAVITQSSEPIFRPHARCGFPRRSLQWMNPLLKP